MEIAENHPLTMPFVEAVGKLLQNFGMIEMLSHDWIATLQTDAMVGELAKRSQLRDRVEIIKKMVNRAEHLSSEQRKELCTLWTDLLPHAEVRNIVAHNPVALGFDNSDPERQQKALGVLNLKPKDRSKQAELLSVAEILGSVNATHALASKMYAALPSLTADNSGAP